MDTSRPCEGASKWRRKEGSEYLEFLNFDYYIEHSLRPGIFPERGSPHYFLPLRWNVPFLQRENSGRIQLARERERKNGEREREEDRKRHEIAVREWRHCVPPLFLDLVKPAPLLNFALGEEEMVTNNFIEVTPIVSLLLLQERARIILRPCVCSSDLFTANPWLKPED